MITGYSDRINHAFAFAAKHHDQQVRKGVRAPYFTRPASVAVVLTRYGMDEDTVIGGILRDLVEDCVRDAFTREMLDQRVGSKFGAAVLDAILAVSERRLDDDGVEMSWEERKDDVLARLAQAPERGRWICAADLVHNGNAILTDLKRTEYPETVWERFHDGREGTIQWYRRVHDRLRETGFDAPIMDELRSVVERLARYAEPAVPAMPRARR